MFIVDYCICWSGIIWQYMCKVVFFQVVQKEIFKFLKGKVVVGYVLYNDFQVFKYVYFWSQIWDIIYVLNFFSEFGFYIWVWVFLKDLVLQLLYKKIQVGQYGYLLVEDVMIVMEFYWLVEVQWEQQEVCSFWICFEDREFDSSIDMEQYMEDQYWFDDLVYGSRGGVREVQDRRN